MEENRLKSYKEFDKIVGTDKPMAKLRPYNLTSKLKHKAGFISEKEISNLPYQSRIERKAIRSQSVRNEKFEDIPIRRTIEKIEETPRENVNNILVEKPKIVPVELKKFK